MNSSPPKRLTLDPIAAKAASRSADGIDQAVADRMAERVVDALEIVEVEDGEAHRAARDRRPPSISPTISWK